MVTKERGRWVIGEPGSAGDVESDFGGHLRGLSRHSRGSHSLQRTIDSFNQDVFHVSCSLTLAFAAGAAHARMFPALRLAHSH